MNNVFNEARVMVRALYALGGNLPAALLEYLARLAASASNANSPHDEFGQISAWALLQLSSEDRLALMSAVDFGAAITDHVAIPPAEWPEQAFTASLIDVSEGSVSGAKVRALENVTHMADRYAHKVAKMSPRDVYTYARKADESHAYNSLDPSAKAVASAANYPHLKAEIDGGRQPDLATAAAFALGLDAIWQDLNAQMETHKVTASVSIATATTLEDISTAEALARGAYGAVVDYWLAQQEA